MEFEITEIKALGYDIGKSLSLRLERAPDANEAQSTGSRAKSGYTIHAVVPYSAEFGNVQVGQRFKFERTEMPLNERAVALGYSKNWCKDSACTLRDGIEHDFGPGCRLYKARQ